MFPASEATTAVHAVAPPHDHAHDDEREHKYLETNIGDSQNSTKKIGRPEARGEAGGKESMSEGRGVTPATTRDITLTDLSSATGFSKEEGARGSSTKVRELRLRGEMREEAATAVAGAPSASTAAAVVLVGAASSRLNAPVTSPPAPDVLVLTCEDASPSGGTGDGELPYASAGLPNFDDGRTVACTVVAGRYLADAVPSEELPTTPRRPQLSSLSGSSLSRHRLGSERDRSLEVVCADTTDAPRQRQEGTDMMVGVVASEQTTISRKKISSSPDDVLANCAREWDVPQPSKAFAVSSETSNSSRMQADRRVCDSPVGDNDSSIRKIRRKQNVTGSENNRKRGSNDNCGSGGKTSSSATHVRRTEGRDGGKSQPPVPRATNPVHGLIHEGQCDDLAAARAPHGFSIFAARGSVTERKQREDGVAVPATVGRVEGGLSAQEPAASSKGGSRDMSGSMGPRREDRHNDGGKATSPFMDEIKMNSSAVILQRVTRGWLARRRAMKRKLVRVWFE